VFTYCLKPASRDRSISACLRWRVSQDDMVAVAFKLVSTWSRKLCDHEEPMQSSNGGRYE